MALLTKLSDRKLLSQLETLVERERATKLSIVLHLGEVERRKLYLKQAYASMFHYCIEHLGYSASAAGRRIQTARCIRRHPDVLRLLRRNELNLSTVCLIAPVIDAHNKRDLLTRVRRRSQREVDAIVSGYRPPVPVRDKVKPVRVLVPPPAAEPQPTRGTEGADHSRSGSGAVAVEPHPTDRAPASSHSRSGSGNGRREHFHEVAARSAPRIERKLLLQFAASEAFMQKYQEAKALLSNKLGPAAGFEEVFEAALDAIIDKNSPAKRQARREKRRRCETKKTPESRRSNASVERTAQKRTRHIPAAVRDEVFARDKGRCTFLGPNGKGCGSRLGLHIDHIVPFAKGGSIDLANLRLLCANHNKLEAERAFGKEHMKPYHRRE